MKSFDKKEIENGKLMAILAYVGLLALIPYLAEKENKYVQAHAKIGMNLMICELILYAASLIIVWIPILGLLVLSAASILCLVISVIGIVNACNGEVKELPIVESFKFIK